MLSSCMLNFRNKLFFFRGNASQGKYEIHPSTSLYISSLVSGRREVHCAKRVCPPGLNFFFFLRAELEVCELLFSLVCKAGTNYSQTRVWPWFHESNNQEILLAHISVLLIPQNLLFLC